MESLNKNLQIPVFHDNQHGTAIITFAALINALKLLHKNMNTIRVVIAGADLAGYGIFRILQEDGYKNCIVIDSIGAIY